MSLRCAARVVEDAALVTSEGESAGDADRAHGVEAVGVADALALDAQRSVTDVGALERDPVDDRHNGLDYVLADAFTAQPTLDGLRPGLLGAAELVVSYVVQ